MLERKRRAIHLRSTSKLVMMKLKRRTLKLMLIEMKKMMITWTLRNCTRNKLKKKREPRES